MNAVFDALLCKQVAVRCCLFHPEMEIVLYCIYLFNVGTVYNVNINNKNINNTYSS